MRLDEALTIRHGEVICFIGAGGKTSALFRLGDELAGHGMRVVGTTTTRVADDEIYDAPQALAVGDSPNFTRVAGELRRYGFVFLYDHIRSNKAIGLSLDTIRQLLDRLNSDVLLVEADGSRRLPFKAAHAHEPVLPPETTQVVLVAGMDVLGKPLDDDHVYNAGAMIERYGYPPGAAITWPWVAEVMRDETLGLRNVPSQVQVTALLNKAPQDGLIRRRARLIAHLLLRSPRIQSVAIGAVHAADPVYEVRRPVAAVVLAAGLSKRMGSPKVLLPWGSETVLETILRRLTAARLDEIVVVTGHAADRVGQIARSLGVRVAHNPDYETGEMLSSLQTGLRALSERHQACLVVLGDQPQMQTRTVVSVLTAFAEGKGSIVAPSYQMRRGHPILIDRRYWPEVLALPSGGAPRDVINAHADEIAYVTVNTDTILGDIDTPDQYDAARRRAGLA